MIARFGLAVRSLRYAFPLFSLFLLIVPVSPNYNLRELNIGNSGGGQGQSANYGAEYTVGELGSSANGTSYNGGIGFGFTQMANVPPAPTLSNPASYYDKLHLVLDDGGNPSDTLFAIAISADDFVTTKYVKADNAIGSTLTINDYQTFTAWGSASGIDVLGLDPGTTYKAKVKAMQGNFTESGYGPTATAATVNPMLTFDIDIGPTDTPSDPPYNINLGTLLAGTIVTGTDKVWVTLDTNGQSGAGVFIAGQNGGLHSENASYDIVSASGDLAGAAEGFGLQAVSAGQTSGGPLAMESPYDGSSEEVGSVITVFKALFTSSAPITAGRGSAVLKAKASNTAPSGSDYTEILTLVGAANF